MTGTYCGPFGKDILLRIMQCGVNKVSAIFKTVHLQPSEIREKKIFVMKYMETIMAVIVK